uniref:Elongator complex protein 5 n=1 Tax=Takifugu rubripes TaxID=31033 RepID=H2TVT7_TAKRU
MLTELLQQGVDSGGFLIIQVKTHVTQYFIFYCKCREEEVHVLGFEVSEEELKDGLKITHNQRLHFHNAYADPLGWNDNTPFTVHRFCAEELTRLMRTPHSKPTTLVIDSLSWVLRHVKCPTVCRTLHQLRKGGAARAVVGLLHTDMHQRGTVGSVGHLATCVITVSPGTKADEAVAKITKRLKSGKVIQDVGISIGEGGEPTKPGPNMLNVPLWLFTFLQTDPAANLTFNLRLSDSEREAKEKLALPFMFSKEKKTALLCSGPGSGQIVYEPDANDDYDEEDPDDDLDV